MELKKSCSHETSSVCRFTSLWPAISALQMLIHQESKAEAALAGKIKCEDFRKNPDGTWTSGADAKIGSDSFSNLTFESKRVTIGGADLTTVLDRKCGH
jgi:hypothetical protein